jgi:hypothetical protein
MNKKACWSGLWLVLLMVVACSTHGGRSGPQTGDPVPEVSPQNIIKKQCIVGWNLDKNKIKLV